MQRLTQEHSPLLLLSVFAAMAFPATVARADRVPSPPDDCPVGSVAQTDHAGPRCEASTCEADSDCDGSWVCRDQPLCVMNVQVEFNTYTRRGVDSTYAIGTGPCDARGACAAVEEGDSPTRIGYGWGEPEGPPSCVTARRCVDPAAVSAPPPTPAPAIAQSSGGGNANMSTMESTAMAAGSPPASPPPVAEADDSGCTAAGGAPASAPGWAWLLVGAAWALWRRRPR